MPHREHHAEFDTARLHLCVGLGSAFQWHGFYHRMDVRHDAEVPRALRLEWRAGDAPWSERSPTTMKPASTTRNLPCSANLWISQEAWALCDQLRADAAARGATMPRHACVIDLRLLAPAEGEASATASLPGGSGDRHSCRHRPSAVWRRGNRTATSAPACARNSSPRCPRKRCKSQKYWPMLPAAW